MAIDIVIGILAILALIWGYRRGLILAIFSVVATVLGILLAFKFSSLVALWLGERTSISDRWLPIVAFLSVLIGVILLVRLGAKALEGMVELAQLGLLNRLAGSLLYLLLLVGVAAMICYVAAWGKLITPALANESRFIQYVQPLFIGGFRQLSQWLPGFREAFIGLEKFFDALPS